MPFLAQEHVSIPTQDLLSWMLDEPQYDLDQPVYIDAAKPSRSISYRQAVALIRRLAAGFRAAGLRKGDVVCLHSFNDIYYSMIFLGIVAAGGIFAGTNPAYTAHELEHAVKTADIKFFVVEPGLEAKVLAAAAKTGIPKSRVFMFNTRDQPIPDGLRSWTWLQQQGSKDWERWNSASRCKKTTTARLFSSGTTGLPKALDISMHNFIAQHMIVQEHKPRSYEIRRLACTPMFHVSQVPRCHTTPLRTGCKNYVMRRFELEPFLRNIKRFEISELNSVPAIVVTILTSGHKLVNPDTFKSVRYMWSGAAPLDAALQVRMKQLLQPGVPFNQVFGMSETTCMAALLYWPEDDSSGSVGKVLPNHDAKLVDEEGRDITGYNIRGEFCIRGPCVVDGYYGNEKATMDSWDTDNFFHTGDIAYCDAETKNWFIVDRKKELIKVRGFQVAPAELEAVILEHPDIIDAAVIGVQQSATESELPRAYVVQRPGSFVTEADLRQFSSERLAKYKSLDGGIRFLEVIPKNASGKILKVQLREQAVREMGARL